MTATLPTRFCLIRHGETDWNGAKRIQGQIDIDLNGAGKAQARALQLRLAEHSFAAVYSSDLLRAWNTARIAMDGRRIDLSPALRERHFGVLQGVTSLEACEQHPDVHRHHQARTPDYDYETGESLISFAARVMDGLEIIAERNRGESVLAFTHGGVLDIVYRAAAGRTLDAPRDFLLPNAALNWLEHSAGGWRLISWGDCAHLQQSLDELPG